MQEKTKKKTNHYDVKVQGPHGEHCDCGHDHAEHNDVDAQEQSVHQAASSFTTEMKQQLAKIAAAAVLFLLARLVPLSELMQFVLYLLAYVIVGGEIVLRAAKNIARGQVFDENFLMSVATIGAFAVGEYPEGVMVNAAVSAGGIVSGLCGTSLSLFHCRLWYQAGDRPCKRGR